MANVLARLCMLARQLTCSSLNRPRWRRRCTAHPSITFPSIRDGPQVSSYYSEYNTLERGKGAQVANSKKVAEFVDKFYSLVGHRRSGSMGGGWREDWIKIGTVDLVTIRKSNHLASWTSPGCQHSMFQPRGCARRARSGLVTSLAVWV